MDKNDKLPTLPKQVKPKELGVSIKQMSVVPIPTPMGQLILQALGLGSDDVIYEYDFKSKKWQVRDQ